MLKSPTELLLLGLLVIGIAFTLGRQNQSSSGQPILISVPQLLGPRSERGNDDRYSRAPRPQRFWDNGPEYPTRGGIQRTDIGPSSMYPETSVRGSAMMDPVPTRGAPEAYQQMGVISGADGKVLPLYGRRVASRSDYFNYYTRTDTYNPVALPVTYQRRDCQDNVGCQELMTGSEVRMNPTGEVGKVMLYGFDGPRYTPDIA